MKEAKLKNTKKRKSMHVRDKRSCEKKEPPQPIGKH